MRWALPSLFILLFAVIGLYQYSNEMLDAGEDSLARFGVAPTFTFVRDSGGEFSSHSLAGAPWIAAFFFTRCQATCPMLMSAAKRVLAEIDDRRVAVVGISVDPQHDTPAVLAQYRERRQLPNSLLLLSGEQEVVNATLKGFMVGVPGEPEAHSNRFVLVDSKGQVRGYYLATDEEQIGKLIQDLRVLSISAVRSQQQ